MRTFEFTLTLQGSGETEEDAWDDAIDGFCADPGEAESVTEIDEDGDPICHL